MPLTRVVAEIFRWVGSPIELDNLVNVVATLLEIKDYPLKSLDTDDTDLYEQLIDTSSIRCDSRLELHQTLQYIWEEIRQLPSKQRFTFCFGFADENGEDLFSLLLYAEVVTLPQIAQELELTLERLLILWKGMPADNASLSSELGVSRAQISKWRFRAVRQLEKRIAILGIR